MEDPAEAVQRLGSSTAAREWLAANAGFDPFEYEEWLASLSLSPPIHCSPGSGISRWTGRPTARSEWSFKRHRRHYEDYPEAEPAR